MILNTEKLPIEHLPNPKSIFDKVCALRPIKYILHGDERLINSGQTLGSLQLISMRSAFRMIWATAL